MHVPLFWQQTPAKLASADLALDEAAKLAWLWSRTSLCSIHLSPTAGPEETVLIVFTVRIQFGIKVFPL